MGMGPVPAVHKCLEKAGWSLADVDMVEANEAFAAQSLGVMTELGLDASKVGLETPRPDRIPSDDRASEGAARQSQRSGGPRACGTAHFFLFAGLR